jgi:hypothetical protein
VELSSHEMSKKVRNKQLSADFDVLELFCVFIRYKNFMMITDIKIALNSYWLYASNT